MLGFDVTYILRWLINIENNLNISVFFHVMYVVREIIVNFSIRSFYWTFEGLKELATMWYNWQGIRLLKKLNKW